MPSFFFIPSETGNRTLDNEKPPHIILIGIDSLRPDFTTLLHNTEITPHVNAFLNNAIAFPETYTPIARTFPAWVSILTGKYPWDAGVDFNLTVPDPEALAKALPHDFKKAGYFTFFATDEKRFSNIDESFGFDAVAGPVMGAADFLLATFNDTALSNLFINGLFGRIFFPFSHTNRPAHITYDPATFVRHLNAKLPNNPRSPAFIAIHLCLPHYPFIWKNAPLITDTADKRVKEYTLSLQAADQQFGSIIEMLERKNLLENAWVILLSDHGEGLGEPLHQPYGKSINAPLRQGDIDWGHGTSVLSPRQYRVMLAFRRYGQNSYETGSRRQQAMLADILPTLMEDLKIDPKGVNLDGISLLPALKSHHIVKDRILFFETGLNPKDIHFNGGKIEKAEIYAGMSLYTINSQNGRLLLKSNVIEREKKYKEYGMIQNGHFLALLSPDQQGSRNWFYRQKGNAEFEIHESFATLPHEAIIMLHEVGKKRPNILTP
nr:sulfatase-like hydrolase/transferase [Desulfobotulus pelophilus]